MKTLAGTVMAVCCCEQSYLLSNSLMTGRRFTIYFEIETIEGQLKPDENVERLYNHIKNQH